MTIAAERRVNLLDPQFYVDPFDAYRWLRDEAPVHWDPVQRIWGISRYADVSPSRSGAPRTRRSTAPAPTPTSATTSR